MDKKQDELVEFTEYLEDEEFELPEDWEESIRPTKTGSVIGIANG